MTRNPFRDPTMRREYDGACKAFAIKHGVLFINGERRRSLATGGGGYGSSIAQCFWNGYDGITKGPRGFADRQSRTTIGYAYYRAGKDCARQCSHPSGEPQ